MFNKQILSNIQEIPKAAVLKSEILSKGRGSVMPYILIQYNP